MEEMEDTLLALVMSLKVHTLEQELRVLGVFVSAF